VVGDGGGEAATITHHNFVVACHSERSEESRNHIYVFLDNNKIIGNIDYT